MALNRLDYNRMHNLLVRSANKLQDYCSDVNGDLNDSLAMEIEELLYEFEQEQKREDIQPPRHLKLMIEFDIDTLIRRFGPMKPAAEEIMKILHNMDNIVYFFGGDPVRPLKDSTGEVVGHAWTTET